MEVRGEREEILKVTLPYTVLSTTYMPPLNFFFANTWGLFSICLAQLGDISTGDYSGKICQALFLLPSLHVLKLLLNFSRNYSFLFISLSQ